MNVSHCVCIFLQFTASLSDLENRTLWLTVWHSDMFGRNDFLGEVVLPLAGRIFDDPTPHWYQLQERVSFVSVNIAPAELTRVLVLWLAV